MRSRDNYWTVARLANRQAKQNKNFIWSQDEIRRVLELNSYLAGLMEEVYADCLKLKMQMDKWISEGKEFYRNYEITGCIIYEIDYEDYEDCEERKIELLNSQCHNTDDSAWCVRFSDPGFCKTELSKKTLMQNGGWWVSSFPVDPDLKEPDIEKPCAFVHAFLHGNCAFSLKDFIQMSEKDFYKHVEVRYVGS